ncbi:MAG: cobamide remodeling phosphodiesterase CbiR [Candidatus Thorarchaeota archaeon]
MTLLFGNRPFTFEDFFSLASEGELDFSKLSYANVMRKSIAAGFKHIEITGDLPYVLPGILSPDEIDLLLEIKKKEKITYSVHLPLWGIEPATFSPYVRKGSVETLIESIELTKPLEPVCWVFHSAGKINNEFLNFKFPDLARGIMMQQFVSWAKDSIKTILEKTDIPSRKFAVENIEFPFTAIEPVIQELDVSICFDTGHLIAGFSGKFTTMEFVERYYERIIELHLHDGAYPRIDHKPLGTQDLPVEELLRELLERKFTGPLVFELSLEEAKQSMKYIEEKVPEAIHK